MVEGKQSVFQFPLDAESGPPNKVKLYHTAAKKGGRSNQYYDGRHQSDDVSPDRRTEGGTPNGHRAKSEIP